MTLAVSETVIYSASSSFHISKLDLEHRLPRFGSDSFILPPKTYSLFPYIPIKIYRSKPNIERVMDNLVRNRSDSYQHYNQLP